MNKYIYLLMYFILVLYYNVEVKISEMMQLLLHHLHKCLQLNNKWQFCISINFKTYDFKSVFASSTLHFIRVYTLNIDYGHLGYDAMLTRNLLPTFRRRLELLSLKETKKNKPLAEMDAWQSLQMGWQQPLLPHPILSPCIWSFFHLIWY